jgi:hypothetical protein
MPSASTGKSSLSVRLSRQPVAAALVAMAALTVLSSGCGKKVVLGKVHGQVSYRHQPLDAGIVGFSSETGAGIHMTAKLDADGRYLVSMAKGYGLPPGEYKVAVYPFVADLPIGSTTRPEPREFPNIPVRYRDPKTSGLTLTVHEGDNPYNIDMEP